jgi:glycosyltransferase involved in cell wall biosynthesis
MAISHLSVITGGYPSPALPTHTPFVRQFAHAMARQGVKCTVIHPVAVHKAVNRQGFPFRSIEQAGDSRTIEVMRPPFFSLSARKSFTRFARLNPGLITLWTFTRAVKSTLKQMAIRPDALYGHFLYLAGAAAVKAGEKLEIPAFPCVGEGEFWTVAKFGKARSKQDIKVAKGFIANSSLLKRMLHDEIEVPLTKIGVFPNGVDRKLFFHRNRVLMRKKYKMASELCLVAFVGNYLFKKGPVRVAEAISGMKGVGGIFMGSGSCPPKGKNIVFKQRVQHHQVPELLSAADIFVLPTLVEGSSNAIVEAMACGLPIVSSKGTFNDDLLTDEMSIRVDPLDVCEIRNAIRTLRDDSELRARMAVAALRQSRQFDINDRTRQILNFMTERMKDVR